MIKHVAAEVFPPGDFIQEELDARGWTQADLAAIMDRPLRTINEIIAAKKTITPETAVGLAQAFGTSAEAWLNLESAYRLSLIETKPGHVERRAKLFSLAPVNDMVKRSWIEKSDDAVILETQVLQFLDVSSIEHKPTLTCAARKSTTYDASTPEQIAWACRVRNLGKSVSASKFDPKKFEKGLTELITYVGHEANVRRVPAFLASIGVRLVIVEFLPRMKMDGVMLWLDDTKPVVGISMRFDRIDYFWFTLLHELIHVKYRDSFSFDERLADDESATAKEKPDAEQRADLEAAHFLVPNREMEVFIGRTAPLFYRTKIIQFANSIKVHPGIIVGQLQRRGLLKYSQHRDLLVKVRDKLSGNAMMDGWGFAPRVA